MKLRKTVLLIGLTLIALSSCSKTEPETTLAISITRDPVGGYEVTSVSAQFKGQIDFTKGTGILQPEGEAESVTVTVEWWWEDAFGSGDQIVRSEMATFDSESSTTKSTSYSASPGFILLNYYWIEIHWTDDDDSHSIQSSKALCGY